MDKFSMPKNVSFFLEEEEKKRLYKAIKTYCDEQTAKEIVLSAESPLQFSKEKRAQWVHGVCTLLEQNFCEDIVKKIRMSCYCDENGRLDQTKKWLKEIYTQCDENIEAFVEKMNQNGAGWYIKDNALFTKMFICECPMLEGVEKLPTKTWCYCTAGNSKVIFDFVFGYEVEVELLKSIKMGDEFCLLKVSKKK